MAKLTEYPEAQSFDENDILIKDGTNGTKKIQINKVLEYMVDPTLTTPGKAADAKATKDAIDLVGGEVTDVEAQIKEIQENRPQDINAVLAKFIQTDGGVHASAMVSPMNVQMCFQCYDSYDANTSELRIKANATVVGYKVPDAVAYSVGRVWTTENDFEGELTSENAPNKRYATQYPINGQIPWDIHTFTWRKTNVNADNPQLTVRFFLALWDSNGDEIVKYRIYSAQKRYTYSDGEITVTEFDYKDSQNAPHIIDLVYAKTDTKYSPDSNQISNIKPLNINSEDFLPYEYFSDGKAYVMQRTNISSRWRAIQVVAPTIVFDNSAYDSCEPGTCYQTNDGIQYNSADHMAHRTRLMYDVESGSTIRIKVKAEDEVSSVIVNEYDDNFDYVNTLSLTPTDNQVYTTIEDGVKYIKVICNHLSNVYNFHGIDLSSNGHIKKCFNPDKGEVESYNSMPFNYVVSGNNMTTGRLLLPPNYSINGNKVPLIVFAHGSESFYNWNVALKPDYIDYFRYLTNEGFALFDCYPWTDKYEFPVDMRDSVRSYMNAPYPTYKCFIEGIRYVCSRFNVDIDNVVMLGKSAGGEVGCWAFTQSEFPFKAVALHAPMVAVASASQANVIFAQQTVRYGMIIHGDLAGTQAEKDDFVAYGSTTRPDSASFISKNKNKLVSMFPFVKGLQGNVDSDDLFNMGATTHDSLAPWMVTEGLPAYSSSYSLISDFAYHDEFRNHATCPVKFWMAFDDANCSAYDVYAVYKWLINGGSDAEFREMPIGTGAHHAVDSDPNALKSSGTTALGIAYTDIPTAYVEAADFFRRNLVM